MISIENLTKLTEQQSPTLARCSISNNDDENKNIFISFVFQNEAVVDLLKKCQSQRTQQRPQQSQHRQKNLVQQKQKINQ